MKWALCRTSGEKNEKLKASMADPTRIQGPSGSPEPSSIKKDKTIGPNDFKKYMVEEAKETDERTRKRKHKGQQQEEDTEDAKKAIAAPSPVQPPNIESVEGPQKTQKGKASRIPPSETPLPPTPTKSIPAFKVEDIEEYAWEEDNTSTITTPTPTPAPTSPPTPNMGASAPAAQAPAPPSTEEDETTSYTAPEATKRQRKRLLPLQLRNILPKATKLLNGENSL